jgi:ribosomal protein S17E
MPVHWWMARLYVVLFVGVGLPDLFPQNRKIVATVLKVKGLGIKNQIIGKKWKKKQEQGKVGESSKSPKT